MSLDDLDIILDDTSDEITLTIREYLKIEADVRVGSITINPWTSQVSFIVEEGSFTPEGFIFHRNVIEFTLKGDTLASFMCLMSYDESAVKTLFRLASNELHRTLNLPAIITGE